ncbi:MAG: hypothetical protein EOP59_14130 [Sphingomonadales bacterium]|nr:MAG: hypothetical protein EOP59_14130 [Sphingomonadales bacterium]
MEMFDREAAQAGAIAAACGGAPDRFAFACTMLPPDPDGAGMFTQYYEVAVRDTVSGKSQHYTGGIGCRWVDDFRTSLEDGAFD